MPRALARPLALALLLAEAARLGRGDDGNQSLAPEAGAQSTSSPPPSAEKADLSPGAMHWVLAVILSVVLVGGLVRVYRVLRTTDSMALVRSAPEGMRAVECGACRTVQYVTSHGRIFICFCCRSANRIPADLPGIPQQELVAQTGPLRSFEFRKGGENFWQELKQEELEEGTPLPEVEESNRPMIVGRRTETEDSLVTESTDEVSDLPQCVVCLDSPGRMVLLPCAHGGVCEECATRIAQNRASGGAHCPHCRSNIQMLVKIHEINGDLAKGIEYRIPMARPV